MTHQTTTSDLAMQTRRWRSSRWATEVLTTDQALIVDTETTRLFGDVLQIGVMDLHGHALVNQLIRPGQPIDPDAERVHGISADRVAAAPTFAQVARPLAQLLTGRHVLAYNAAYDRDVLAREFTLAGIHPTPAPRWSCLIEAREPFTDGRRLKLNGPHDALGDCAAALALLYSIAGRPTPDHLPPIAA